MEEQIRFVQQELIDRGLLAGEVTGTIDTKTRNALANIIGLRESWKGKQRVVGLIQLLALEQGLTITQFDGLWGPETSYAYEALQHTKAGNEHDDNWRDTLEAAEAATVATAGIIKNLWPQEVDAELVKYYGQVGENQARIKVPYPHVLAWDNSQKVKTIRCHEKVAPSVERVLKRVLDHYGEEKIKELGLDQFGGCLNVRKIRGGSRWSTHAWGIALDYNPEFNQLRWDSSKASFAKPEFEQWWKFWEEEGWYSLGRQKNYDWMHVQAALR